MKRRSLTRSKILVSYSLVLVLLGILSGCRDPSGLSGGPYSLDDDKLLPFAAMYEIDRDSFCLTEIDPDSQVDIDARGDRGYDVVLRLHNGKVSRTVAFILEGGRYVWIGEQEVHRSGQRFMTPDGSLPELIAITYEREYGVSHEPPGPIISYQGESEITSGLTCEQAHAYIRDWGTGDSDTE